MGRGGARCFSFLQGGGVKCECELRSEGRESMGRTFLVRNMGVSGWRFFCAG